jgi:hypothetical protein
VQKTCACWSWKGWAKFGLPNLEDGEVPEDEAVGSVAAEMGCGALEIRLAAGGRANLFATEDGCVLVDDELLRQTTAPPASSSRQIPISASPAAASEWRP